MRQPLSLSLPAFSIAEVVLSGFILTTGIITVMSLFSAAHRGSFDTRNVIIASELAQEGVEVARNIRDNDTAYRTENWTTGDNCQASTTGNCDPFRYFPNGANQRCTASYNSAGASTFTCPAAQTLLSVNNQGFYQHGGAGVTSSRFYRLIKIDHTGGSDTARVQSFVAWTNPGLGWNPTIAACNPYNQCVYTELLLSTWK